MAKKSNKSTSASKATRRKPTPVVAKNTKKTTRASRATRRKPASEAVEATVEPD